VTDDSRTPDALVPGDLQAEPVWEFVTDDELTGDETSVRPVSERPVRSLDGRLIGTQVRLRNGSVRWAMLSNLSPDSPKKSQHFATLSLEKEGRWFHLARYFDADYETRGARQLADFLDLPVDQVFPISYDVSGFVEGNPRALRGSVVADPKERLDAASLVELSLSDVAD
jgi:hypothetical protein